MEEILYPAMEDYQLDLIIGEGPAARSVKIDLSKFTLIGATTRLGLLTTPLRDRFGIPVRLDFFNENVFYHEVYVPTYPLFQFPPYESALASKMVDITQNEHLDVLHVHYDIQHASAAYLAKQILRSRGITVPVVTTLHGTDITLVGKDASYEPVVTFSINQSDGVTSVSADLRRETYEYFPVDHKI